MCNYLVSQNIKCKISPNKPFCHLHVNKKPKYLHEYEKVDKILELDIIKAKNEKLNDKIDKKNKQINTLEEKIKTLNAIIKQKNIKIDESSASYKAEINELKKINKSMEEDYKNFQIIREYENIKHNLIKQNIDIYNFNDDEFHKLRLDRNIIVHEKTLK